MEMLRRGMVPPPIQRGWRRMQPGPWTQAPPGAPVPPPPGAPVGSLWCDTETAQDSLRRGIKTTMVGLALLIGLSFIGYRGASGPFGFPTLVPGPWLLGGLIPTFVGIAQLLVAILSGARFGPYTPPPPGAAPPPPGEGSYDPPRQARPVNPFEELPPAMRPPDRR
jgi:hypothetical protein